MSQLPQVRASQYAQTMADAATQAGRAILRMDSAFPSMRLTRRPLIVWIDKGKVLTSDGPLKGHEICSAMMDTREDSTTKRTIVLPSLSDARRLAAALGRAKFRTPDQRNAVFAGRRALQVAIATPWFSPVLILTRALTYRYWAPTGTDTDDVGAWGKLLGVSSARSVAGIERLLDQALSGPATWGRLAVRLNSTSERVLKAQLYSSPVTDAQSYAGMEAIGDLWRAFCAADGRLRPYSLAARKTVAVKFEARPPGRDAVLTATVPAGSIPFRQRSTVWVVDPEHAEGTDLAGGELTGFGFDHGVFRIEVSPQGRGGASSIRRAVGREVFLIEAPFGGAPKFVRPEGSRWENGVPPSSPVNRTVPAELALAGMPVDA